MDEFVELVMKRLTYGSNHIIEERDAAMIRSDIPRLIEEGFTVDEAVAYLRNPKKSTPI